LPQASCGDGGRRDETRGVKGAVNRVGANGLRASDTQTDAFINSGSFQRRRSSGNSALSGLTSLPLVPTFNASAYLIW
jgi:hypothetical protein